jgi:hypothetical protein
MRVLYCIAFVLVSLFYGRRKAHERQAVSR